MLGALHRASPTPKFPHRWLGNTHRGEDWGGSVAVLGGGSRVLWGMPKAPGSPDLRGTQGSDATRVYGTVRYPDTPGLWLWG